MESEFSIQHSFWYYLNPVRWTKHSLCVAFIAFYALLIPAYFIIGFRPATAVAETDPSIYSDYIDIPSINLSSPIIDVDIQGTTLATPDYLVGRYISENSTFLFAHSITAFRDLHLASVDDTITYNSVNYHITSIVEMAKEDISMSDLLNGTNSANRLILMTCSGEEISGNYTHRLIITAETF